MSTACVVEHGSSRSAENSYIACRNSPLSFGMACTRSTHFILRRSLIICVLRFSFCYLCPDANPPNNAKIFNKFLKISNVLDESDRIHRLGPLVRDPINPRCKPAKQLILLNFHKRSFSKPAMRRFERKKKWKNM